MFSFVLETLNLMKKIHGKTTLGKELLGYLQTQGVKTMLIDGDQLRDIFKNVNYGKEGRVEISSVLKT